MEWAVEDRRTKITAPVFHSPAQAHGPTSAVSETEERTSIVPASTGVGAPRPQLPFVSLAAGAS